MKIGGYDYKFAYTVGAHIIMQEAGLPNNTQAEKSKFTLQLACAMNVAYEDQKAFEDPRHKPRYLEMKRLLHLPIGMYEQLAKEVNEAYERDCKITVETENRPKKDATPAKASR